MAPPGRIPLPPLELRTWVGPTDPADYENPSGTPIYAGFDVPLETYETVFDFGCGCGRVARQLLQQDPKPRRYVGIDVNNGLVEWCQENLSPVDQNFRFFHHNVYSPNYAPGNRLQLALPLPANDGEFTLVIAHSVFTHLTRTQAEYYLSEITRILAPRGMVFTSWFFFDRASFPFLPEVYCLYTSESDFSQAVLFDREWFIATIRNLGLGVRTTRFPWIPGHQWNVFLVKRTPEMEDHFPLGEDGAEWVCGASAKRMAEPTLPPEIAAKISKTPVRVGSRFPGRPPLFGALAELDRMEHFWSWTAGRVLTSSMRAVRKLFRSAGGA